MKKFRTLSKHIKPQMVIEGAGVLLRRSIAPLVSNEYDPFLLFDNFAFNNPKEGPARGFPTHPHRGIETVTYMLDGSVAHRDSLGNAGMIGAGDVQWMTSGRGILHEEMPRRGESGNIFGFQLWVNLPAAQKMSPPRYQEIKSSEIPVLEINGAQIRLVAGELNGARGPVTEIAAAPLYMDVTLSADAEFTLPVPRGHTALAYLFEGAAEFSGEVLEATTMAVFKDDGDSIKIETKNGARFILIAGAPFKEPIVPYGPFVMNTVEEIKQTILQLQNGTFIQ
ncbi:MAG: pirin family protein [Anaerolineales bacterium]